MQFALNIKLFMFLCINICVLRHSVFSHHKVPTIISVGIIRLVSMGEPDGINPSFLKIFIGKWSNKKVDSQFTEKSGL